MKTLLPQKVRRGFTLLELMVAMAITTVIVTVLVGVTSVALDAWTRSRAEVRASRQAKSMVDTMARDFEALVTRKGNSFEWLFATVDTTGDKLVSSNAANLIFFTAATDRYAGQINTRDDRGGDVSCVSYRLRYQDPIAASSNTEFSTFALYRLLVNPDETFTTLLGKTDLRGAFSIYDPKVTNVENFVCENVYQFTTTFYIEISRAVGSRTTKILVPVSLGSSSSQTKQLQVLGTGIVLANSPTNAATLDELKAGRIAAVEISLTVLSDFGVSRSKVQTFKSEQERAKFFGSNSFQYSKRVEIPGL
jgi:prepilin-type N-terminal cleavage/methylation domain-containing protein